MRTIQGGFMIKKFIVLFLFAVSAATVQAKIDGDEVAAGIFGFILGKIIEKKKGKKDDEFVWDESDKVILKKVNNQLVLGNVVLKPSGVADAVAFPRCNVSKNDPVGALRFRVDQANVYVRHIQITYQNGERENVSVNRSFAKGTSSDWYNLQGKNDRCVKRIRVSGESLSSGKTWQTRNSIVTFVGWL
jgi:Protein of unknown function (DUF2541)